MYCRRLFVLTASLGAALLLTLFNSPARAQSNWTLRESGTGEWLTGATYGNGLWVVGGDAGTLLTSADGASWTVQTVPTSNGLRSVIYAGGQFVAVGQAGTVLTSADGVAWVLRNSGTTRFLSGIAHGAGTYVATGEAGTILTSPDGSNWSPVPSPIGSFLQAVAAAESGRFVAVGASGNIVTSDDGSSWSAASSNTSNFLSAIAATAGQFFAVGQGGSIIVSADGQDWSAVNSGTAEWLNSITAGDVGLVAVGCGGTILSSSDGTDWAPQTSPVSTELSRVAFAKAGGGYLGVGEPSGTDGAIVTAPIDRGFAWASAATSVLETEGSVSLTLLRFGDPSGSAQVEITLTGDTATAGDDFTDISGPVQFDPGETEIEVLIPIADDAGSESPESFQVGLANPGAGYLLHAPSTTVVVILDDEDSDLDGLPDDWEILHFGQLAAQDGDDDTDGDGNDNRRELDQATDPDDPESAHYFLNVEINGDGSVARSPDAGEYAKGTQVTLTATPLAPAEFGTWGGDASGEITVTTVTMDGDRSVSANFFVSLAEALDVLGGCLSALSSSGSGPAWIGQTAVSMDGQDAAMASGGSFAQFSQLTTTLHGPARVHFFWKLSGNPSDLLRLDIDGIPTIEVRGETDWEERSVLIRSGVHQLVWRFQKFTGFPGGDDAGWVDQVSLSLSFEDWQAVVFPPTELSDPSISGADADPDGDLLSNAMERALGLDPLRFGPADSQPQIDYIGVGGERFPAVTFPRAKVLADAFDWKIQASADLSENSWHDLPAGPVEVLSQDGSVQSARLTANVPITALRQFYRFVVTER